MNIYDENKVCVGKYSEPTEKLCSDLSKLFLEAMRQQNYSAAREACEEVLKIMPANILVLSDYALALMREGNYHKSYEIYKCIEQSSSLQQQKASATWLDGLAEVCGWLGKAEEVKAYGGRALRNADAVYSKGHSWNVNGAHCRTVLHPDAARNVIAFSLFGAQPRYCETMIKNAAVANELYPGWTCRVYLDGSVPVHVWQRLSALGVQLVNMSSDHSLSPTMWRFLVVDDAEVDRFIIRDADALISERESAAVQEWISSGKCFHHMRDYFTHTELLLAGMWGGITGIFPPIYPVMQDFVEKYSGNPRFMDQHFLRKHLWPTIRKSLLSHDEIFDFCQPLKWPKHQKIRWNSVHFHVGSNVSYSSISNESHLRDGEIQRLRIVTDEEAFDYHCSVYSGRWSLALPFFLVENYRNGLVNILEI